MTPIYADVMDGAIARKMRHVTQRRHQKQLKLARGELTGRHREMMSLGRLRARDMPIDRHVVGRVSECHAGLFRPKEERKTLGSEGVITSNDMVTRDKLVARLSYWDGLIVNRWKFVLLVKSAIV